MTTPSPAPPASFPTPRTRLIGREAELAMARAFLLEAAVPLLTLTGPSGVGKTRLALQIAADLASVYADGVVFVPLAAVHDPAQVLSEIAHTLRLRPEPGRSWQEELAAALGDQRRLLVLDNLEQLVAAAPALGALLAACPRLQLLTTSRVRLQVDGEQLLPVAPLPLPAAVDGVVDDLMTNPAVSLFAQRAHAIDPRFSLTAQNAPVIAQICQRLDGLPLAIELAAARSAVLAPDALLARLGPRLPLLTGGPVHGPDRLRTMRHAIAWSYDLLAPPVQRLFRHLAVFADGCALAAAAAVAGDRGDLLEGVTTLVASSLLHRETGSAGEPRYRMLETIREFGDEQLGRAGEDVAARGRHARFVLDYVARWLPDPPLPGDVQRLAAIDVEYANIRLALAWCAEQRDDEGLARLAGALFDYWYAQGLYCEGRTWLRLALERRDGVPMLAQLRVLGTAGALALAEGDLPEATRLSTEELPLARTLGDTHRLLVALFNAALLAQAQEDYQAAEAWMGEAHELALGWSDQTVGRPIAGIALGNLGGIAAAQNQLERAVSLFEAAIARLQAAAYPWALAEALGGLAGTRLRQGQHDQAVSVLADALANARQALDPRPLAALLLAVASVATAKGQLDEGARLLGAAEAVADRLRTPWLATDRALLDPTVARLVALLGAETATHQRNLGQDLTLAQALTAAEQLIAALQAPATRRAAGPDALTPREREVLGLVARGWTDREIAEALFISRKTASNHVANILAKLGAPSRHEAVEQGRRLGVLVTDRSLAADA